MSIALPPISSLYQREHRSYEQRVPGFAPVRNRSRFICISSPLSIWSNTGEMQI